MYSPEMIYVTRRLTDLQAEAATNRLAKHAKGSRSRSERRIAAALSSVRSILTNPAEGPTLLPKLSDYPHRS